MAAPQPALIPLGIRPVGIYADTPIADDLALDHLDLEGIEIVGEEWGVINVEAVAALEPDLIVAEWWPVEKAYSGLEEGTGGGQPADARDRTDRRPCARPVDRQDDRGLRAAGQEPRRPTSTAPPSPLIGPGSTPPSPASRPPSWPSPTSPRWRSRRPRSRCTSRFPSTRPSCPTSSAGASTSWCPTPPTRASSTGRRSSWENAAKYQADLLIVDERGYPANVEEAEVAADVAHPEGGGRRLGGGVAGVLAAELQRLRHGARAAHCRHRPGRRAPRTLRYSPARRDARVRCQRQGQWVWPSVPGQITLGFQSWWAPVGLSFQAQACSS